MFCIAIATTISSCKKETIALKDTTLEITVSDDLGNKISGATVVLYATQVDFNVLTNPIGTILTDAKGVATFKKLSAIQYYLSATKDCKNNMNEVSALASPIPINMDTKVGIVISSTGSLKFINTSTNPYDVYINSVLTFSHFAGATTVTIPYKATGIYTIRVVQISGYLLFPTDNTYTSTLTCGSTVTTTFP